MDDIAIKKVCQTCKQERADIEAVCRSCDMTMCPDCDITMCPDCNSLIHYCADCINLIQYCPDCDNDMWFDLCFICKKSNLNNDLFKDCEKCGRKICYNCVGLTACQTLWCICNRCYDYKCGDCETVDLAPGFIYLNDDEPINRCKECQDKPNE